MQRTFIRWLAVAAVAALPLGLAVAPAAAANISGAIFTTLADGSEVNFNIYQSKADVYLDGGPGPGAPQGAAGLPDGVYVFMVTDPSGKTLLSTDPAICRQFQVTGGIITGNTSPARCAHVTGVSVQGGITVQLLPYNDTPNNGDEYKVWVTRIGDYACSANGVLFGMADCSFPGTTHGFVPGFSKTDNFKVGGVPLEIDTRFFPAGQYGSWIDGLAITHTDPLGGTDVKWSYLNTALDINHEAHVEDVEAGTHYITVDNQPGCTVGHVLLNGVPLPATGPQTVPVIVKNNEKAQTLRVDVECA